MNQEDTCRGRTVAAGLGTARECHLGKVMVTTDFERCFQFEEDGLLHEDLLALMAEALDFSLEEVDLFGDFGVAHAQQFLDDVVDVDLDFPLHLIILNCDAHTTTAYKSLPPSHKHHIKYNT